MEIAETYEKLRILLSPKGFSTLPKNELTLKLLHNIFSKEEAELVVASFDKAAKPVSFEHIKEQTSMSEDDLRPFLRNMKVTGKITGLGPAYMLLPYLPGLFELYFTYNRDDPERMKKAGEAHHALQKSGFHVKKGESNQFNNEAKWRIFPTVEPVLRQLKVNQEVEVQHEILPFEIIEKYLSQQDTFAIQICSCRNAAKLSGNPCKQTDENFCISAGLLAKSAIKSGTGKEVSLEELMEIMKKAEKAGLVHSTTNMTDASMFICNCCSCCCGFLETLKTHKNKHAIARSNFEPIINHDECSLCEDCLEICPMEAIEHSVDAGNGMMLVNRDDCLGCGVCASNCPEDAILLKKTGNHTPVKRLPGLFS